MSKELAWVLYDKKGRKFGPFSTTRLTALLLEGYLTGDEEISVENESRRLAISKYPEFYEIILESLQKTKKQRTEEEVFLELTKKEKKPEKKESPIETQVVQPKKERGKAIVEPQVSDKKQDAPKKDPLWQEQKKETKAFYKEEIVDLSELKRKERSIKPLLYIASIAAAIFLTLFLLNKFSETQVSTEGEILLLFPEDKPGLLNNEEQRKNLALALREFEKDNISGYQKSMAYLVRIISSNKKNLDAISLLCLVYRELWPHTSQGTKNLESLTKLVQIAQVENSLGIHGTTCRLSQGIIISGAKSQDSQISTALSEYPTGAVFYEMKAESLAEQKQYDTAIAFVQKTQSLWPNWKKSFFKEAYYRFLNQDYSGSEKALSQRLSQNETHAQGLALLGILEVDIFKKEAGVDKILIATKSDRLSKELEGKSFATLARHFISTNSQEALKYAKKSFEVDPTNSSMRDLIIRLGGEGSLNQIQAQDSQLIYLGDSYFKNKNYLGAQAQYKAAFDLNPKNPNAALKAAESLWKLNQTQEAIDWARKAVQADPNFSEAYFKLADYFSQKFDFKQAIESLSQAPAKTKNSYQFFRSYAQVELRRKNIKGAIQFSEKALKLYDSDVESLKILSEAFVIENNYEKAFQYSAKAVQMDSQNAKAHEIYALSLLGFRGYLLAQEYINNLINTYPSQPDYKIALAAVQMKDQRFNDAIDTLNRVNQMSSTEYRSWMMLGDAYNQTSQLNDALKSYFKAASLDPSNSEPHFKVGQVYLNTQGNHSKALKQFQKVIQTNPRYPLAHYFAAQAAYKVGEKDEAQKYLSVEKKTNPNLADPYILAAQIAMDAKNYSLASRELSRAVKLRPNDSNLYIELARNYRLSGQMDAASSMLRVAQRIESGNPDIYREQGAVFERLGLNEQAALAYGRYLELKPNAQDKEQVESRIRQLGGN